MFDTNLNWQVPVLESTPQDCKWPADMDSPTNQITTHYCGAPVLTDKVYCAAHYKLAYTPSKSFFKPGQRRY